MDTGPTTAPETPVARPRTGPGCWPGSGLTLVAGGIAFLLFAWLLIRDTTPHYGTVSPTELSQSTGLSLPPSSVLTNSCTERALHGSFLLAKLQMNRADFARFKEQTLLSGRWSSGKRKDAPAAASSEGMPYSVGARQGWWDPEKARRLTWAQVMDQTDTGPEAGQPFRELLEVVADLDDPQVVVVYIAAF